MRFESFLTHGRSADGPILTVWQRVGVGTGRRVWQASLIGLTVWSAAAHAQAQFQPPQNAREYEDTGTLEGVQDHYVKFRDSKNDAWVLETGDHTTVEVTGEAERDYLHSPALHVQFTGQVDKKGTLQKAIEEVKICADEGKAAQGVFQPGEGDAPDKPVRGNMAGKFVFKGRLVSFKDGQLTIMAGSRKITGKVSDGVAVTVNLDDPNLAEAGDTVKVKAWYYDKGRPVTALNQPGQAMAEEIKITLAKPLAFTGKKPRTTEKPAKATAKSGRLSK